MQRRRSVAPETKGVTSPSRAAASRARRLIVAGLAAAASLVAGSEQASSQPVATSARRPAQESGAKGRSSGSFRTSMGVAVAERLLASDNAADRLRGVERLGSIGTPEAIDALLEALEQGSAVGRDPRARLLAVRALADHAKRDGVRQLLSRELSDAAGTEGRGAASPLSVLTRSTAALALARAAASSTDASVAPGTLDAEKETKAGAGKSGGASAEKEKASSRGAAGSDEKKALNPLVTALLQGGAPAEVAARALTAYPPSSLAPFLEGKKRLSTQLATYLGDLGDLRAIERLRAMLSEPDPAGKGAAAVALAKLGDEAALAPARTWIGRPDQRLQRAAAEVLTQLGASDAPQAIAVLLGSDALRLEGIRLASLAPSPSLAKALATAVSVVSAENRPKTIAALGRAGGSEAVKQLTALLAKPELAVDAAYALAVMPEQEAREAIGAALAKGSADKTLERILLRAGIARALVLRDPPGALEEQLEARLGSKDPSDRAIAALGLVALGARDVKKLLDEVCPAASMRSDAGPWKSASSATAATPSAPACDEVIVRGAARGALARGRDALEPFMALLQAFGRADAARVSTSGASMEPDTAVAAGVALLVFPDGGELPTSVLAAWAEAGGPLAPLAARALPSRDDDVLRGRLKRLLEGSDPVIRAHVALGLGRDPEPDAVSLLTSAYQFEEDASVRRAIVRALSRRAEGQRVRTLTVARDLDPDPVGSSRVDLQACKLEYSIVSPK